MKLLTYVRLGSYAICTVAFFMIGRQVRLIPLSPVGPEYSAAVDDRHRASVSSEAVPRQKEFRRTRLSGSEVVALAENMAKKRGDDLSQYGAPHISLREESGKLVWSVSYYHVPEYPGGFFTIGIDDENRNTTIYPGM
jgi:hypothetical protein